MAALEGAVANTSDGQTPEVEAFIRDLLDRASRLRLSELFTDARPDALWYVPNRHGVSVVALRTSSLSSAQLVTIMTYRLAQYLMANQLDPHLIFEQRLEHEPLSNVSTADIHIVAGAVGTGELLCYMTLKALHGEVGDTKFRDSDRPLFPVEEVFGAGVYNRTRILPDLPARRVREAGRFAKNQRHHCLDEHIARAPVEIMLATTRLLTGPLMREVDVCIGDLEETVAKKNHDFFHLPTLLIPGVVPYTPDGSFGFLNYQSRTRLPYALLSSDIPSARLDAIERALELPGKQAIMALLAMKADTWSARSSLEPPGGLPRLTLTSVPDQGGAMAVRRELLDVGGWLRSTSLFKSLSVAEAAVLGTFLERCTAAAGDAIVRQGETGEDLYLVEAGQAEVQVHVHTGERTVVAMLGPGDCFGEIALVTGGERIADVVALTPMSLLRLSHDAYARYLAHMLEVQVELARTAATRAQENLRAVRSRQE
jgi:hypothetical protein